MSAETMEREIAQLKKRVETLERDTKSKPSPKWLSAVGIMKDCDLLDEAVRLGATWRQKANREGN